MSLIQKCHVGVNVRPTSPAARNYLILNDGDVVINIMETSVWLNNEGEGKLGLLQQGVCGRDGIEGGSDVFGRAVRMG